MQMHAENTTNSKGDNMPTIIIGKPGSRGIAIGPGAVAVGAGGVIIDGDMSGTYHISGDNNDVTIPANTPNSNIVITGNNNQVKRGQDERRIAR